MPMRPLATCRLTPVVWIADRYGVLAPRFALWSNCRVEQEALPYKRLPPKRGGGTFVLGAEEGVRRLQFHRCRDYAE